jgi:chromosome segregation ATPase
MDNNAPDWLREHVRNYGANFDTVESTDGILEFRAPRTKNSGASALDLVNLAAELIGNVDNYAAEREGRAEKLAKRAIEELKLAEDRIRSSESGRRAAEAEIEDLGDRVDKAGVRLQQARKIIEQMTSLLEATEARLSAAEQRASAAEARAKKAEEMLERIEEAIRNRILAKMPADFVKRTATAA